MRSKSVFIVEDDPNIQQLISYNLSRDGYLVSCFDMAEKMLERVTQATPDLIILDIMLPGIDGVEACHRLRSMNEVDKTPILMLTAKGEEADIVTGLELGADDYMVKPFSPRVLSARVKALIRRRRINEEIGQKPLKVFDIEIHPGRHDVTIDGESIALTASEFSTLYLLASKAGWVFTRYQIVDAVHGANYPVTDRSVDVMIAGLRKKLGEQGAYIETVRGIGYKFKENDYE